MKRWSILLLAGTFLWMGVIFALSARPAKESQEDSYDVAMVIGEIFVPDFEEFSETRQKKFAQKIQLPVRKAAHFIEYLILGALLSETLRHRLRAHLPSAALALGIGILFALSDEFHQTFVPGRVGHLQDVMIDSSGALTGILLLFLLRFLISFCVPKVDEIRDEFRQTTTDEGQRL